MKFVLWSIMIALSGTLFAQQLQPAPAYDAPADLGSQVAGNLSVSIRWVAQHYISPESEKVDRNYLAVETFDEVAGEDVRVEVWGTAGAGAQVWVMIHDRVSNRWWAYGPAVAEGSGIWKIHGVRFGEGVHQGRRFTIRAAVLRQAPEQRIIEDTGWFSEALAVSDPVYLTVKKRLVRPYAAEENVSRRQIWISTVEHLTVSPTEAIVVPPTATVTGTFQTPETDSPLIYVIVRSTATDRWRVFGPAVQNGIKWDVSDVSIADPGEPNWSRFKVTAIMTGAPLQHENIDYEAWWQWKLAASEAVEVAAKPFVPSIERPLPNLDISKVHTFDDTLTLYGAEPFVVDSIEQIIQLGGSVGNLPQGASVWVLINPLDTPLWEVHGKAVLTPPHWRMPLVHAGRLSSLPASKYRIHAVVTTSSLRLGLIDYESWRSKTLSMSEGLLVHESEPVTSNIPKLDLAIDQVGGSDIENPHIETDLDLDASVSGSVNQYGRGTQIYVATRPGNSDEWRLTGPAFYSEDGWNLPQANFDPGVDHEGSDVPQYFDVVAVATQHSFPAQRVAADELQWYALATSPVVRVQHVESSLFSIPSLKGNSTMIMWILLFLILVFLEYQFGMVSSFCHRLAASFDDLHQYLAGQFTDVPRPAAVPSAFALVLLILGVFAIVAYFPIYTHVLERVLHLTPEKSESLALLLIVFIGLAGVITHLSIEYVSNREGAFLNRIFDYFLNYALPITVLLVTFALWGVQALLYLELYMGQVEPGNIRIPAAMGAAAFFIAGIETLGFYWVTRLGKDLFGWVLVNVVLLAPPVILSRIFLALESLFAAIPFGYRKRRSAEVTEHSIATTE